MKRLVLLALALVMALSLAAPALAFTGLEYEPAADNGITLDIKLVDVTNGFFGSSFNAPATNRGYARNQVVCAVVDMVVPKGKAVKDSYDNLVFAGKNVSLWQDDNFRGITYGSTTAVTTATSNGGGLGMLRYVSKNVESAVAVAKKAAIDDGEDIAGYNPFTYADNMDLDNSITLEFQITKDDTGADLSPIVDIFPADNSYNQTYQFAIFGRVLADDAEISATLKGKGALVNAVPKTSEKAPAIDASSTLNTVPVKGGEYFVAYYNPNIDGVAAADAPAKGGKNASSVNMAGIAKDDVMATGLFAIGAKQIAYIVSAKDDATALQFVIVTALDGTCKAMYVYDNEVSQQVYRVSEALASTNGAAYVSSWDRYVVLMDFQSAVLDPKSAKMAVCLAKLNDVVADTFKLDVGVSGQLKADFFAGNAKLSDSVKIEPWYSEVTVPPEIEIEIPKTGDALSAMGFVLMALAGLAVVAVRKVKA